MRTLHIIGEDFELGLGVYCCLIGKEDIVILLISIRFLGDLFYHYLTIEHIGSFIAYDTLIILVTFTIRLGVVHQRIMVGVL